ncbi:MAG TPA: S-layer homology domain-containing protein [Oscillospiraceae bacterium]|nr:S-layer homology domain-containing protein [Oscillospiraceae bacterium]
MKQALRRRIPALLLALSLFVPAAAAADAGMSNFKKTVGYTGFPDVAGTEWFAADVEQACRLGIMNGRSGGVFAPGESLTLAEAVTMAARTHDIYLGGGTFTAGGDPWYRNAVSYALEEGIILEGEYLDYTALATRADMAHLFARALPAAAYSRINRIASIPDVDKDTPYVDEIFRLYGAGVLTGGTGGYCLPYNTVTRGEAAAIISRVAVTASRRSVTDLTAPSAGTPVSSHDGSFDMVIPAGTWQASTLTEEQIAQNYQVLLTSADGTATVLVQSFSKSELTTQTGLSSVAFAVSDALLSSLEPITDDSGLDYICLRGYAALAQSFTATVQDQTASFWMYYLENSENYYVITLCIDAGSSQQDACFDILYTFDAAL